MTNEGDGVSEDRAGPAPRDGISRTRVAGLLTAVPSRESLVLAALGLLLFLFLATGKYLGLW